jgi:hypothetical protein
MTKIDGAGGVLLGGWLEVAVGEVLVDRRKSSLH